MTNPYHAKYYAHDLTRQVPPGAVDRPSIPRSDIKQPAKVRIARLGNLRGILDAGLDDLQAVAGIGAVSAHDAFSLRRAGLL